MNKLFKYLLRPLMLITLVIGAACFFFPDQMKFIPWEYRGEFVIAAIPSFIALMLDGAIGSLTASLKLRFATGE
jgi:hypothetical protein